ncbi:MAG: cation-translocating P-type ATPase [Actinomycetes bacterium]
MTIPVTTEAEGAPDRLPQGLTTDEAASRLASHGPNTVATPRRRGVTWRAARQLGDPMLLLLMAAACLTLWQHDIADTIVIVTVIVLNTAVGVAQELRAERAITALRAMAAPHARVHRDGRDLLVMAAEVVPGDILLAEAGDIVAADAQVFESHQLQADEAALTGESVAAYKTNGDELFSGTTVTRGRGRALVTRTGPESALGHIAGMVASARPGPTPLQMRLDRLGRQLTVAALVISAVVMALALLRGESLADAALSAASLAVAAVPESLPAVLTLSLALGAHRMAQHAAIARELRAVETLGSVTLLATDKTGTLTENRMVAERLWVHGVEYDVAGAGYEPTGTITPRAGPADGGLHRLLRDVVLCNDADVEPDPGQPGGWRPLGDPTEAALVVAARRGGVDVRATRERQPRRQEIPFQSERAWMATAHDDARGGLVVCKGAPDVLLDALGSGNGPGSDLSTARDWAEQQAREGARVLAVAETTGALNGTDLPHHLELVGLVAMTDPPRRDLTPVLQTLHQAGIRVVVMTGDHPATAEAVSRRVGLLDGAGAGAVVSADALEDRRPGGITERAAVAAAPPTVFARVRPEHKLALVRAWQQAGEVVAVTGDGVNDGPALRMADIGVAMGQGGTEVARQAADLVLTDDRLETVALAVEEGRRIHDNLRRFLRYALSGGLAEVLFMLGAPALGFLVPLLPGQILWINMLTHGLPGVALGAEPASPGTMQRPPISRDRPIIDRPLATRVAVTGTMIAVVTAIAAEWTRRQGADWRTSAFLVLGLAQLGMALAIRDPGAARSNRFLSLAVAVAVALQAAAVLWPPLRTLLDTVALPPESWLVCVTLAAIPGLLLRLTRRHDQWHWPNRRRPA